MLKIEKIKSIIIYDPYTSNGFFWAQKLATKGFTIHLFTNLRIPKLDKRCISDELKRTLTITDLSQSCNNNFLSPDFYQHCDYLMVMNTVADAKWFFDKKYDFSYELKINKVKNEISLLAKEKYIKTIEFSHCSIETLSQIISEIFDFIYRMDEKRLYLNTLHCDFFVMDDSSYLNILENFANDLNNEAMNLEFQKNKISLRDIFRLVVENLGAEIEFCGKFENEKAVIVDYDMDASLHSKLFSSKFRLGNTIIKINEQNYNVISTMLEYKSATEISTELDAIISNKVKKLIQDKCRKLL